jgi:hypothetical protein
MISLTEKKIIEEAKRKYDYDQKTGCFTWKAKTCGAKNKSIAGTKTKTYIYLRVLGKIFLAHRLAWAMHYNEFPKRIIDHINGNKFDNRITNLRDVNQSINLQNQRNPHQRNKQGLLNITLESNNKYKVQLCKNKKIFYIGVYETIEYAIRARNVARSFLGMNTNNIC